VAVGILVLVAGTIGFFIGNRSSSSPGDLFSKRSDIPPVEFLYLDYGRVLPYLSQLENGLSSSQLRTLSRSSSLNAGAGAGQGVNVGGTLASESSLQETVTPTASSQFYQLEEKLREQHWLKRLDATPGRASEFQNSLQAVGEGSFVRITDCKIIFPAYARLYPALKRKAPALPFTLKVTGTTKGQQVDLLFPVAYAALANAPSFYSTRLTVLGKVIRRVDNGSAHYVDVGTKQAFDLAVDRHAAILKRLGLRPRTLKNQFAAAVTVNAPGAVILPIAIFK
jgi:hypothetical protein